MLARRKGAERRPSALTLEARILDRLPERGLLDILARTAHLTGWHRHFGPPSGSDPKIGDTMGRYVVTAFAYGGNLGPTEVARHMRGISAHDIYTAGNKHADPQQDPPRVGRRDRRVREAGRRRDVGRRPHRRRGRLADRHLGEQPPGRVPHSLWRVRRHRLPADLRHLRRACSPGSSPAGSGRPSTCWTCCCPTTRRSGPSQCTQTPRASRCRCSAWPRFLGFELLPRIRNWHDLNFYRPDLQTRYKHIDSLFGDNAIDWDLLEKHWPDLLRTGISIREGRLSSVTLLRRLGNHSRRSRLYKALRELGRVVRTVTLLRYLSEPTLREHITAVTNRTESFHNYATWLMIGGRLIGHNDPDYQERVVKFNELIANAAIYSTALDITDAANALAAEGHPVDTDDLATITPYITRTIRRFGDWVLDLEPPDSSPVTRLDLQPRVLFPAST